MKLQVYQHMIIINLSESWIFHIPRMEVLKNLCLFLLSLKKLNNVFCKDMSCNYDILIPNV